jgi:hypothetical protein
LHAAGLATTNDCVELQKSQRRNSLLGRHCASSSHALKPINKSLGKTNYSQGVCSIGNRIA